MQSVGADDRWNDFVSELEALDYDIESKGTWGNSTVFPIKAGVRQGCVLSPRLFC